MTTAETCNVCTAVLRKETPMPKLTVIIPVYNGMQWISRCLDSLAGQDSSDFRILLIDDGSTDQSAAVINEYKQNHPQLSMRLLSQSNAGVSAARNRGIAETDTPYIAFIDQDDYVAPDYLRTYMTAAETGKADIVCGGYQRIDERGHVYRRISLGQDAWAKFVVVAPWAHIYRTEFLRNNHIEYLETKLGEDVYFSLMAYSCTDRIVTIPYTGYYWVDNPRSVSNSRQKKVSAAADPFVLLEALDTHLPANNRVPDEWMEYYLYRYIIWYILYTVRQTDHTSFAAQHDRLIAWLQARYPHFYKNRNISLFRPAGEPFSIRLSVVFFNTLYRLHLSRPVLSAFCFRSR